MRTGEFEPAFRLTRLKWTVAANIGKTRVPAPLMKRPH
jgi:hypothetical protein